MRFWQKAFGVDVFSLYEKVNFSSSQREKLVACGTGKPLEPSPGIIHAWGDPHLSSVLISGKISLV